MSAAAVAAFDEALDQAHLYPDAPQPLCHGKPELYTADIPPSEKRAKELCAPCPLLAICKEAARGRAEWGVRGGIVWLDGKQFHWLARFSLLTGEYQQFNHNATN